MLLLIKGVLPAASEHTLMKGSGDTIPVSALNLCTLPYPSTHMAAMAITCPCVCFSLSLYFRSNGCRELSHKYLNYRESHYKPQEPAKFQCIIPRIPPSRGHYPGWNEIIVASRQSQSGNLFLEALVLGTLL